MVAGAVSGQTLQLERMPLSAERGRFGGKVGGLSNRQVLSKTETQRR